MATTTDIRTFIVRDQAIREGRPRIAGTGVTVRRIVSWYQLGLTPEEIARRIGHISLAQVYAALAYYQANREEIEADLRAEEEEAEALNRSQLSPVEIERLWLEEAERRYQDYLDGKVQAVPGEEVLQRIRTARR